MSLAHLMKTALPMNRKERFFTGTVFPGILCKKDFQDLGVLASLIPGCVLPPIDPRPATTNIQFFTEYSLVESIYGPDTKERFPTPPTSKDTPDILILVSGEPTVLIALEAKMYDQPSAPKLTEQMRAQRVQLDYLRQHLALDAVHHAALLPRGLADKIAGDLPCIGPDAFPIILWEDLSNVYRAVRNDDDYFLAMLDLALSLWPTLAAQQSPFGMNVEQYLTGQEIHDMREDAKVRMVGRRGGYSGELFAKDVATGTWKNHRYEVSSKKEALAGNPNWFAVEEFVIRVTRA